MYRSLRASTLNWPGAPVTPNSLIRKIRDGEREPVFYVGTIDQLTKLAEAVGPGYPLYGVRSYAFLFPASETVINSIATCYCDEILKLQGKAPFRIMSFCGDGLLAWEIARQLEAKGGRILSVALVEFDMIFRSTLRLVVGRLVGKASYRLRHITELGPKEVVSYVAGIMKSRIQAARACLFDRLIDKEPPGNGPGAHLFFDKPDDPYVLKSLDANLILFYLDNSSHRFYKYKFFQKSWLGLTSQKPSIHFVPGLAHDEPSWPNICQIVLTSVGRADMDGQAFEPMQFRRVPPFGGVISAWRRGRAVAFL